MIGKDGLYTKVALMNGKKHKTSEYVFYYCKKDSKFKVASLISKSITCDGSYSHAKENYRLAVNRSPMVTYKRYNPGYGRNVYI